MNNLMKIDNLNAFKNILCDWSISDFEVALRVLPNVIQMILLTQSIRFLEFFTFKCANHMILMIQCSHRHNVVFEKVLGTRATSSSIFRKEEQPSVFEFADE